MNMKTKMKRTQKMCLTIYIKSWLTGKNALFSKEISETGEVESESISLFLIVSAMQYLRTADAVGSEQ